MFAAALPTLLSAGAKVLSEGAHRNFLNLALGVVVTGVDVIAKLQALDGQVGRFVAEGRDPTDAEWDALAARDDAAAERIDAAGN